MIHTIFLFRFSVVGGEGTLARKALHHPDGLGKPLLMPIEYHPSGSGRGHEDDHPYLHFAFIRPLKSVISCG